MQNVFNITSIEGNYSNKTIIIQTNYLLDETTINKKNVKIVDASSVTVVYKLSVDKDKIIITLKEWPLPNCLYQVNVTDIKDKLGRELVHPLTKNIEFKADTKLKAKIVSPQNNEAVNRQHNLVYFSMCQLNPDETITAKPKPEIRSIMNLPIQNEEVLSNDSNIEAMLGVESDIKYHIEFASDVAFSYVVKDYLSEFTDGLIELSNGQYYARARVIEDDMHGDWSETITFSVIPEVNDTLNDLLKESQKEYIEEMLAPIDFFMGEDEEIKIVSHSDNGETYSEFYIEFNIDLDKEKIPKQLIAYRRNL